MTANAADTALIATLTSALHTAQMALESALAITRPDLLDEREKTKDASRAALRRIGSKGGTGAYLFDSIETVRDAQNSALLAAVARSRDAINAAAAAPPARRMVLESVMQNWDIEPGKEAAHPRFKIQVEQDLNQLLVKVFPESGGEHTNLLDVGFEISGDRPRIHVHGSEDELALSISTDGANGVLLHEGDAGPLAAMEMHDEPASLGSPTAHG